MFYKRIIWLALAIFIAHNIQAMNFLRPYDSNIDPLYVNGYQGQCWGFSLFAERGVHDAKAFNSDSNFTAPLRIWQCDQNALQMLDGFPDDSPIGKLRMRVDANDDGTRGHFNVCGNLNSSFGGAVELYWFMIPHLSLTFYFPFYKMTLTDVIWQNLTKDVTIQDARVREYLTDDFFENVKELGDCLNLQGWSRTGLGDMVLMLAWLQSFEQERPMLKQVDIAGRLGINFPTGLPWDEDKLFAVPFGYDRAFGAFLGGGLSVLLGCYLKAGFDVELLHLFGNTRARRIKTSENQTELLLLQKTEAYKDFGLTQRFNLFIEAHEIYKTISFRLGYQFLKHGDDKLSIKTQQFSNQIANTAVSLEEYAMHQIIVNLHGDIGEYTADDSWFNPELSFYARLPFLGQRSALIASVGGTISFRF